MRWGRVTPKGLSSAWSITPTITDTSIENYKPRPFQSLDIRLFKKILEIFRTDSLKSPIHFLKRPGSHRHRFLNFQRVPFSEMPKTILKISLVPSGIKNIARSRRSRFELAISRGPFYIASQRDRECSCESNRERGIPW